MKTATHIFTALELLDTPRRVLLVEDNLGWLHSLSGLLESRGHSVIRMIGVLDLRNGTIEGLGEDGKVISPAPEISEIDVVFLDYNFAGRRHNGASFLQEFRRNSIAHVIAMSSDRTCNDVLSSLGATLAMQKHRLRYVLLEEGFESS